MLKSTTKMPQRATYSSTPTLGQRLLSRCLPIVGTGCLMYWLSGGFYPHTWQLFFQACAQFSRLQAQQGTNFLFPFAVLAVQSLLLAIAWGLLLRLAFREGSALLSAWKTRNATVKLPPLPAASKPGAALPAPAIASPAQNKPSATPPVAPAVQRQSAPVPQQNNMVPSWPGAAPSRAPSQSVPSWPVAAPPAISWTNLALKNPFEESGSSASQWSMQSVTGPPSAPSQNVLVTPPGSDIPPRSGSTPLSDIPPRPGTTPLDVSLKHPPAELEPSASVEKPRGVERLQQQKDGDAQQSANKVDRPVAIPSSLDEDDEDNDEAQAFATVQQDIPADQARGAKGQDQHAGAAREPEDEQESGMFSSVLHDLGFFHPNQPAEKNRPATPEPEKKASLPKPPSSSADAPRPANPFDVQSGVFNLFSSPDAPPVQKSAKPGPEKKPEQPRTQTQISSTDLNADQVYMLGNPFEGTLPEVFEHDEDLKHAVLSQVTEELEQRAKRRKRTRGRSQSANEKGTERQQPQKKTDGEV